ncbi:undecaprenyl/decaprenyl-phosphate alpha-N-acetylglucosaminyl 1-phosphate transferase [Paenibacillus sambharensis]|uniref:Undecaprenyl/decaprenyl-phosphate alpha-N-acetylglucosaminyl 1-phosphate transferase n=2 Tax=Paenibacillus sambharensis TaxID=1803190 RepID=A0A2W1LL64_9BACL|nr:undecaprenyl/decaprenyl-phosphate alpha-N-acetylglucosaminyl 1-phosphate transferase [Paenibacillus sambharensis]
MKKIAIRYGVVDRPGARKIHSLPVPLLGGTAIYVGTIVSLWLFTGVHDLTEAIAIGGLLIVAIGLLDDITKSRGIDFPVWPRIIVYTTAAIVPVVLDIRVLGLTNPGPGGMFIFPYWLSGVATVLWIFAMINMVNFIDGVDGLAAGVCMISSLTLFVAAFVKGNMDTAVLALIVFGACAAFLTYNFYPARIFMGDAGAAFLGYTLAVIAVQGTFKGTTFITTFIPFLALGVPIMDTLVVMMRRAMEGRELHKADKLHTHHVLMRWGLTQIQTVSFMYLLAIVFSLLSIVLLLAAG